MALFPPTSRRSVLFGGIGSLALGALAPRRALATPVSFGLGRVAPFAPRAAGAESGTDFAARTADLSDAERYDAAVEQVVLGNVPAHLRSLTPVLLRAPDGHRGAREAVIHVTPDYLAVGDSIDFLRVPLDLHGARAIASTLGLCLPTPRMVDAIYEAASTRLSPQPLPPTSQMRSMAWITRHQALIAAARAHQPLVPLIAGHKKDVVLTGRLSAMPDRVAIYGWHRLDGRPIQPLSLVHGAAYADYSHGIRLVHPIVHVDGRSRSLAEALEDPAVSPLLTREGRIPSASDLLGLS